ncbi:MAG: terminase small subunit [Mucilaginibacter sp.]|uniref:terminase small subunit n=1 Tax=Mucilaginibacter sp. TaxID=1882438 RepID=UPI003266A74C
MAAPIGNQFWMQRSKHGRDKLFASPSLLWGAACEYFEWCVANPIVDPRSFGGKQKIQRPFTMQGLCLYLNCNTAYFRVFKSRLEETEEIDQDFDTVITCIEETVYQQKFENAAIGVYNQNIIARDLGLVDKQDIKKDMKVTGVFEIGYDDEDDIDTDEDEQ